MAFVVDAEAYQVSGVVDFSYEHFSSKIGNVRTSSSRFIEHYQAQLITPIYDPRFLRISAGINYSRSHNSSSPDSDSVAYNATMTFFPGRPVSWAIYGNKSVIGIDGGSFGGGYDVDAINYGGSAKLSLNALARGWLIRNRNNNYFNNDNNSGNNGLRRFLARPLPEFLFSYDHSESTSRNAISPIDQVRDQTKGSMRYRAGQSFSLNAETSNEKHEDRIHLTSYEFSDTRADSAFRLLNDASMVLHGRHSELQRSGYIAGGGEESFQTDDYSARLVVNAGPRLQHAYGYAYRKNSSLDQETLVNRGDAEVRYRFQPEVQVFARLLYELQEYTNAAREVTTKRGGAALGTAYRKEYSPEFLDPFALYTSYDITAGMQSVDSNVPADPTGRGRYYQNAIGLGFNSIGWKQDNLSLDYRYFNMRDHSPSKANARSHNLSFGATTTRVPKTQISASVNYALSDSESSDVAFTGVQPLNTQRETRSLTYTASAQNNAFEHVTLLAGAQRGKSTSSTLYTLATVTMDYSQIDTTVYAQASWQYPLSATLWMMASIRDELRRTEFPAATSSTEVRTFDAALTYRIRRLVCGLTYRFREDIPSGGSTIQQQSYYIKIARPF